MSYNFNPYNSNCQKNCHTNDSCQDNIKTNDTYIKESNFIKEQNKECNCYKKALRESFEILSCSPFNSYVDFSRFTLYGHSCHTSRCNTTLKSVSSCNCDLLEYSDNTPFNTASLCDLVGYSFQLLNPSTNLPLFSCALKDYLCHHKGECQSCHHKTSCSCDCDCDNCCCNSGKAAKLNSLLGLVNLCVKGTLGSITDATLLAIADDIVWLSAVIECPSNPSGEPGTLASVIYAIPLYNIEFLG